ncbi:EamA family transporter [Vibrio cholerae]|nr:eamA-like transporter family protein [Vibrio cholerae]KEH06580.1 membrane protein [Vibrio cholerae 2012EL-1759]EGQ7644567.1 EamA family transporter [Vibrio cholerae]EGR2418617.1 hypothetical protein [Vibrio cholerae]KQA51605.1 membrane protein [Vibrio cholerae]
MGYFYILGCIVFTVYGQLVLKWRMSYISPLPDGAVNKGFFLVKSILVDPFLLSGFVSAFVASLFWMAAMTKFHISYAYPFMALSFVFVMVGAKIFFGETLSLYKIIGTLVVILGLIILNKG